MAITRKDAAEYASELETGIKARNDSYDTKIGPIPDLYINPAANVLELQNERVRGVQQLLSLINDGSFTSADIDQFVYNELMVRLGGSKSTVPLVFSRTTLPTANITVLAGFPVATLSDEDTGTTVTFVTTEDATLIAANAGSYYNNETGKYELLIPAESTVSAAIASVGPNRITRALRPLNGFDSVFNRDASIDGADPETDDQLITRYYLSLLGTSPTVDTGIKKIIKSKYAQVRDINVVYGNSQYNVRGAVDSGAIDVYTVGVNASTHTETLTMTGLLQKIPFTKQPVLAITSVPGYIQGTDYVLYKDVSGNAGSMRGQDAIQWKTTGSAPAIGATFSVTYTYNTLIGFVQTTLVAPGTFALGSDPLAKDSVDIGIRLDGTIKVLTGFNTSTTLTLVTNILLTYINSLLLGQPVEQSDLQQKVRALTSIDNFTITNLSKVGTVGVGDISIGGNEHASINAASLNITVI